MNNMNKLTTMESLTLPQDLYWDGKMEPISPSNNIALFSICEEINVNWIVGENSIANDFTTINCDEELELKHDDMDITQDLLNEDFVIELYDLKEENFYSPTQLENSLDNAVTNPTQATKVQIPVENSQFGFAVNHSDNSILTQLTPPSSPPYSPLPAAQHSNFVCNWSVSHNSEAPVGDHQQPSSNNTASNYDIEYNTQIIDDILKTVANEYFDENESQSSVSTPSLLDYNTTSTDDDEWMPSSGGCSPVQMLSASESLNDDLCNDNASESSSAGTPTNKKRTRPYGRGVEDRKIRKKEQNKNAATRYRQKKKLEMEHILVEEHELLTRHDELKRELAERKREAKYLKTLIREFYKNK